MKRNKVLIVILAIVAFVAPIILNFTLLLPSCIPQRWLIGDSIYWHTFWPTYLGALGTLLMALMTYKTLKQNEQLIKEQNSPILSCSLAIGKDCIYIAIKNTSSVPSHNVKVSLTNNTTNEKIYDFDSLSNHLANMSFDISPFDTKQIPIRGIQPYVDGKYDGYLSVTLFYNGKSETFNMYLSEINVTAWTYTSRDICSTLKDINSTMDTIQRKI